MVPAAGYLADANRQFLRVHGGRVREDLVNQYDAKNDDRVVLHKLDDAVRSEDHFAKVGASELWNDSTNLGRFQQRFSRFDDAINEGDGVEDGIAGDKVFDVLKIVPGSQRPADLRHRAILSFSSSCVRTRPSATS